MPRLTRTQKFAGLREQLANDKEEKIVSQDFSSFQNRFVSTEDIVAPNKETVKEVEEPVKTVIEEVTTVEETPAVEEELTQVASDTPLVEEQIEEAYEAINELPVQEKTSFEEWAPFAEDKTEEEKETIESNKDTQPFVEDDNIIWTPFVDNEVMYNQKENEFDNVKPQDILVLDELDADKEEFVEEKIDDLVPETAITFDRPAFDNPIFSGPAFDNPAFENPTFDKFVPDFEEEVIINEPETNEVPSIEESQESINEQPTTQDVSNSYFDKFVNEPIKKIGSQDDFNSYFEDYSRDEQNSEVFKDVTDESGEYVSLKERNTYLDQTFSDVKIYNENAGEQTINQLLDSSVDEIRHPEDLEKEEVDITEVVSNDSLEEAVNNDEIVNNPFVDSDDSLVQNTIVEEAQTSNEVVINEEQKNELVNDYANIGEEESFKLDLDSLTFDEKEDEKFSNTVTMEISKIMDEMSNHNAEEEIKPELEENALDLMSLEEEKTATIDENSEDVVEIKNISEIKQEEANTMTATKTFVVASDEDNADDEDEDGSNTVLNVILIVLIVVLIAVLGLIVFYILKTKGIF